VITDLNPNPATKDSGVKWLGDVPEHWEAMKLKHLTRFYNGFAFKPSDWVAEGIPIIRIKNLNGSNDFNYTVRQDLPEFLRIQPGDLLFSWSGNRGTSFGSFIWNRNFEGYLNQHIFKLDGYNIDRYYFAYLLRSVTKHVEEQSHGIIGLVHVTKPELGRVLVPIAPAPEHASIVRFLDYVGRRIQCYIQTKQKLIKLLEEQKQAIIHRAVTRGLDPNVPLKPSGVEWLGDVPEHWEVRRNGRLFAQRNETGFSDLPILEVSLRTGVRVRDFENLDRKQVMSDRDKYKRAVSGDIAYNMMRMWQGAVGVAPTDGLISPAYVVAKPLPGIESRYFVQLFRTAAYMTEIDKYSRGIVKDRNRLYWEDFKRMPSCYPPSHEQVMIADAIDNECNDIDTTVDRIHREIELLREYRTRLIADVVTGKLDVREEAAQLPTEDKCEAEFKEIDVDDVSEEKTEFLRSLEG